MIKYEKLLICTPLCCHYMFYILLRGNNSRPFKDIKFKFSAFLSVVEATKIVKFQRARYTGFKVGIFRISPIGKHNLCQISLATISEGISRTTLIINMKQYEESKSDT